MNKPVGIKIGEYTINTTECEKLLGIKIDVNLNVDDPISDLCKKPSRKISALARITLFMRLNKRKLLMNAFFTSQFSYCSLIWMCHSRSSNRKTEMPHAKCLSMIYNEKQSPFTDYWIKTALSQFTKKYSNWNV